MENNEKIKAELSSAFGIELKNAINRNELETLLTAHLNKLINEDFASLVRILYRLDIDEKKLKELLALRPDENAASTIARMIVDRQLHKIQTRKMYSNRGTQSDEEKW